MTENEMAGCHHPSVDMCLSKLHETVKDREVWHMHSRGLQSWTQLRDRTTNCTAPWH